MKTTKTLPKRNNATNGQKAHNDNQYYKVGRIRMNSWANKILDAYDIIVYETELVHIAKRHNKELKKIGLTPFDFVKFVCNNFNELRKGKGLTTLLVVRRQHTSNMAAIEIHKEEKNGRMVYKINTAAPFDTKQLLSKKLLYANDH